MFLRKVSESQKKINLVRMHVILHTYSESSIDTALDTMMSIWTREKTADN
jgi:hypothetical protein